MQELRGRRFSFDMLRYYSCVIAGSLFRVPKQAESLFLRSIESTGILCGYTYIPLVIRFSSCAPTLQRDFRHSPEYLRLRYARLSRNDRGRTCTFTEIILKGAKAERITKYSLSPVVSLFQRDTAAQMHANTQTARFSGACFQRFARGRKHRERNIAYTRPRPDTHDGDTF